MFHAPNIHKRDFSPGDCRARQSIPSRASRLGSTGPGRAFGASVSLLRHAVPRLAPATGATLGPPGRSVSGARYEDADLSGPAWRGWLGVALCVLGLVLGLVALVLIPERHGL